MTHLLARRDATTDAPAGRNGTEWHSVAQEMGGCVKMWRCGGIKLHWLTRGGTKWHERKNEQFPSSNYLAQSTLLTRFNPLLPIMPTLTN
jgi:hypothetical protein